MCQYKIVQSKLYNSDMFRFFKNNTQGENIDQICIKNELN
jgi:hypothetical protein